MEIRGTFGFTWDRLDIRLLTILWQFEVEDCGGDDSDSF